MPAASELIAHNRSIEEIAAIIGADRLFYQDLEDLIDAVSKGKTKISQFDTSCFSGDYITKDVTEEYLKKIAAQRCDSNISKQSNEGRDVMGL